MENKLIPMTDFVLSILNNTSPNNFVKGVENIRAYAQFLKQPLALWMFVPCDEDGNLLEKPKEDDYSFYTHKNMSVQEEYEKAKSRVLFEGFRIVDFEEHQIESLKHTSYLQWDDIDLISKKDWEEEWNFEDYTVEFLLTEPTAEITLTETAIKQIYGS
ncbi:hypothetical protein HZP25_11715 [Elizabethkingia anophelis]|nr:hypothetical protein [Elizabethkingia anophelis]